MFTLNRVTHDKEYRLCFKAVWTCTVRIFPDISHEKERLGKLFLSFVFKEGEDEVFHRPPKPI